MSPRESIGAVATRIQDSEASVGEKVFLFEAIGGAVSNLANMKNENASEQEKQSISMLD